MFFCLVFVGVRVYDVVDFSCVVNVVWVGWCGSYYWCDLLLCEILWCDGCN